MDTNAPSTSPGRAERAITSKAQDQLERSDFIRRLADALISPATKQATGVVIGITGQWGSGKSSVLNLLREHIKAKYPGAVVVRFDPWLISGRTDLITEFINELIRTINSEPEAAKRFRAVVKTFATYGQHLGSLADSWIPMLGRAISVASRVLNDAIKSGESLAALRSRLIRELEKVSIPIVVLIDEVDRIEDDEIRTIAQLVRSVADFPGMSYVLAYDAKRVVQALGAGVPEPLRAERGRSYLEKIVQLQVPLPVTFSEEIIRMLNAELVAVQHELQLPENFQGLDRYKALTSLLVEHLIATPRDIARLVGTFHALAGMLGAEVDWVDLLGYCALVIKAPLTVEVIRNRPDEFTNDILSEAAVIRQLNRKKESVADRLDKLIPESENHEGVRAILGLLFPGLSDKASRAHNEHPDALFHRRPLLTTLRLGLLPGTYSAEDIAAIVAKPHSDIPPLLREAMERDELEALVSRLDDLYPRIPGLNHVQFWTGVADFVRKPDCKWIRSFPPMYEAVKSFAEVLERAMQRDNSFQQTAREVFEVLRRVDEDELTVHWLRRHIFAFGLFGRQKRPKYDAFLTAEETEKYAREMSAFWKKRHLGGNLIPCRWDLMPLYVMLDTGDWDNDCRALVDKLLSNDEAVDALSLLFYGAHYTTERETVEKICTYDTLIERVRKRLKSPGVHESVTVAMKKFVGDHDD